MEDKKPLIELKNVSKSFGDRTILKDANLQVYPGDALVVIGPSGTGKSTILRLIAGLTAPDSGEIYINGQKRKGLIEDYNDPLTISMVFQQAALFDSADYPHTHPRLKRGWIKQSIFNAEQQNSK